MSSDVHHVLNPLVDMCRTCDKTREVIDDEGGTFEYGVTIDGDFEHEKEMKRKYA